MSQLNSQALNQIVLWHDGRHGCNRSAVRWLSVWGVAQNVSVSQRISSGEIIVPMIESSLDECRHRPKIPTSRRWIPALLD